MTALPLAAFNPDEQRGPDGKWGTGGITGLRSSLADWSDEDMADIASSVKQSPSLKAGDKALSKIIKMQGFDAPVQHGNLSKAVKAGGTRIYRGSPSADYNNDFLEADTPRQGLGVYGNGTYFGTKPGVAKSYAGKGGSTISAVLSPDAKVANYWDQLSDWTADVGPTDPKGDVRKVTEDFGRWAAMRGYDAIVAPGDEDDSTELVVLNRGKVMVA
jgi:hypothetical protein